MSEALRTLLNHKKAGTGHFVLPGGIIVNYGVAVSDATGIVVATYDKPFTSSLLCATLTAYVGAADASATGYGSYNAIGLDSKTQLRFVGSQARASTFNYIAIGY